MAETLFDSYNFSKNPTDTPADFSDPSRKPSGAPFSRKIDFHLARKPFTGFSSGAGGFKLETLNPTRSDPHRPGGSIGLSGLGGKSKPDRPLSSEFLDFGLDPELGFGITFRRIGAGLENLGNTCFLNSVLQCLTYTEPLAAYLQSGKHQNSCRTAGFCALCAIQKHVSRALQLPGRSLAPKDLVSNLRCISRSFRNARQEDAHEYMVNLLESMHKCCLPKGVPSESPSAYEKSLVHKIFGGRLRSQVKCMQCSFCSDKFDPFLDLSLEINKAESLYKALTHFTTKEYLDGGERQYQCQKCKHKVKALKQLTIHQVPHVLTIHLKRFGAHQPGQKIDKKVQFGPTLDLKPFVTGPYEEDLKYTLYGVLVHAGWSTHSGHYYCYVRTSSGMWYSLDDHQVRQVSEKVVLEQKAYMLFYVRDRTNSALKKHVGFVQKESMITNAIGSKMYSTSNQGSKETVQNGPIDKRVNGTAAAVSRNDAIFGDMKESISKEASIQKTEGPTPEISSKLPISNNAVNRLPIVVLNGGEQLTKSATIEGSDKIVNNALGTTTDNKTRDCSKERFTKEDNTDLIVEVPNTQVLVTDKGRSIVNAKVHVGNDTSAKNDMSESITIAPGLNGHHISAGDSCIMETTPRKIHGEASLQKSNERESIFVDHVKSLDKPSCKTSQAQDLLTESAFGDGQWKGVIESAGLSGIQAMDIASNNGSVDHKRQQKSKKKLPKCPINRVHLGSSILFGVYLGLRKKKHKKIKRRTVRIGNLTKEHLMDSECSPSTSEITRTLSLNGRIHSQEKGPVISCSNKRDEIAVAKNVKSSDDDLARGAINKELRERIVQNGAVLSTDKQPLRNFGSPLTGNELGTQCANGTKESSRDSTQNGLMNMLTRGLEEKTVARWDGIELPPSQIRESNCWQSVRVGHIGDEWDEEYDRGKRKKVRISQNVFGGPNLFQEIASKKAKLKKVKMDQSSSGNRPFRI